MAAKRPSNPGLMTSPLWGLSFPICEMGVIIQPDRELCKRPSWKPLEALAWCGYRMFPSVGGWDSESLDEKKHLLTERLLVVQRRSGAVDGQ